MFKCTFRPLAMGAFCLFMREQKTHPKLQGLPASERTKQLATMYKGLTPTEKEQLEQRAKAAPTPERKKRKVKDPNAPKVKRAPSAYAAFVKENMHKFNTLPHLQRMQAVAKLWNIQKPK